MIFFKGTPILPQLCIGVHGTGLMYDYDCFKSEGLVCQKDPEVTGIYYESIALIMAESMRYQLLILKLH